MELNDSLTNDSLPSVINNLSIQDGASSEHQPTHLDDGLILDPFTRKEIERLLLQGLEQLVRLLPGSFRVQLSLYFLN